MKKSLFYSLKTRITAAILLLLIATVFSIVTFWQIKVESNLMQQQYRSSESMLNSMLFSVENNYQSILYHQEAITRERKLQLQNMVTAASVTVEKLYQLSREEILSENEAQERAIELLHAIRYQNDVGYIWINDTTRSFPTMIMHPTLPELNGQVLNSPEFNCALGRSENLFRAFVDVTAETGEGFVDYLWPKPLPDGLSEKQPKLSFVKRFQPWGWIVGTGLYIDDIEEEVNQKILKVQMELQKNLQQIAYSESGYGFIFNSAHDMIVHPLYKGREVAQLTNPATGNLILDDLITAADSGDGKLSYIWDKPNYKGQFRFRKNAYVVHFEPLDWYIATSFYKEDIERPIQEMRMQTLLFSTIFIGIALLLGLYIASIISRPFRTIMKLSNDGIKGKYSSRIPVFHQDEFGELAQNLNQFMNEIEQSHTELSNSESRFRTLFEKSSDARLILKDHRIIDCNGAALDVIGCPDKSFLLDKSLLELSPEFQPGNKRSAIQYDISMKRVERESRDLYEWEYIRYDGSHFIAEVQLTIIGSGTERLIHVRFRDLTEEIAVQKEKQKAEEQLLQMQKMETVGTLAGGFAHDFNNILNGIVGVLSLMRNALISNGTIPQEELEEDIAIMEQSSSRAEKLVRQLLTLSRKQTLHFEPVDLNNAMTNVVKLAESSLDKSVLIKTEGIDSPAMVNADAGQIEQVILNFCVNGSHAMTIMRESVEPWGGTLTLAISKVESDLAFRQKHPEAESGQYWCLSVADTGVGMDKNTIAKIFTPFFTTKEKGTGTGLGLSMVYNIISQHSGFISVNSEPGIGTTFEIYLPVLKSEEIHHSETVKEEISRGSGTVLVIDDEAMLRRMAEKMLVQCGYTVLTAKDGLEGIETYQENGDTIDVVLLDMAMPLLSGKDTYLELQKINPQVKVLLTSGFQQDERVQAVLELGVKGFIQKPYSITSLSRAIKMLLI